MVRVLIYWSQFPLCSFHKPYLDPLNSLVGNLEKLDNYLLSLIGLMALQIQHFDSIFFLQVSTPFSFLLDVLARRMPKD